MSTSYHLIHRFNKKHLFRKWLRTVLTWTLDILCDGTAGAYSWSLCLSTSLFPNSGICDGKLVEGHRIGKSIIHVTTWTMVMVAMRQIFFLDQIQDQKNEYHFMEDSRRCSFTVFISTWTHPNLSTYRTYYELWLRATNSKFVLFLSKLIWCFGCIAIHGKLYDGINPLSTTMPYGITFFLLIRLPHICIPS